MEFSAYQRAASETSLAAIASIFAAMKAAPLAGRPVGCSEFDSEVGKIVASPGRDLKQDVQAGGRRWPAGSPYRYATWQESVRESLRIASLTTMFGPCCTR